MGSRNTRNPYLFLLLKRMLDYEFVGLGDRLRDRHLAKKITYRNHNSFAAFITQGYIPPIATFLGKEKDLGETIRKEILIKKDFSFSEKMLDLLARQIFVIDNFNSWKEFENKYKEDHGAIIAEAEFMDKDFSQLDEDDQQDIYGWVDKRLLDLHFKHKREDKVHRPRILRNTERFVVRTPNRREVKEKIGLSQKLIHYAIGWFISDRDHFTIYLDNYRIRGHIILLAIKSDSMKAIRGGFIHYPYITSAHLHSKADYLNVTHIHVFDFEYSQEKVRKIFLKDFENLITSLSGVSESNLMISITKTPEKKHFCDEYELQQVGQILNEETGLTCNYYEVNWKSLKEQIMIKG